MSIFRETFHPNISASLAARQSAMTNRTTNNLQYLNSRNTFIRMVSSVNTYSSTAPNPPTTADLNDLANYDNELAQKYVLQGGTLLGGTMRKDIGRYSSNAYSTTTPTFNDNRLGIRPMPGITSIDVKTKTAYGSLREATVNFQCWDIRQLEDLELLYMRPGYTVLLEWGWAPYLDTSGSYQPNNDYSWVDNTLYTPPFSLPRAELFKYLYEYSIDSGGNYDSMLGYVKNYQWSARDDGGYDCQTTLISTGEVIESLKINYVKPDLSRYLLYASGSIGNGFLDKYYVQQGSTPSDRFAQEYEKNILAGIFTEFFYKNGNLEPHPPKYVINGKGDVTLIDLTDRTTWPPISVGNFITLLGLKNLGDKNTMIEPSHNSQPYITLNGLFRVLNELVIAKDSNKEYPILELSVFTNNYDGNKSEPLLCVAHPLQISTDPSICLIKNPLWEELLKDTVVNTAPSKAKIQSKADDIARNIIAASQVSSGTNETDFLKAIQDITNNDILDAVNTIFINGKLYDNTVLSNDFKKPDGLAGVITDEFTSSGGVGNSYGNSTDDVLDTSSNHAFPAEIVNMYYLYMMREHFKSIGITDFKVNMKAQDDVITPSGNNLKAGDPITLDDFLKGATPPSLAPAQNILSTPPGLQNMADLVDKNPKPAFYLEYYGYYTITGVTLTVASNVSLIFNAEDAYRAVHNINEWAKEVDYFYNNDPYSEIGYINGILINMNFLYKLALSNYLESQDDKEKNEINVYNYIKSVISAVNGCLGNVANLELHVDPVDNIGRVIDINYTDPNKTKKSDLFELQVHNLNSVVRSYNLQSKMFPSQGAIIAIGSQAKGGQAGIQNNTMIDFNTQLTDRIFPKKAEENTVRDSEKTKPTLAKSLSGIIELYAVVYQESKGLSTYTDVVGRSKNALRDLIVYFQTLTDSSGSNRNIIPIKFSFTMDGIGGLVIGQLFTLNDDIIPRGYKRKNGVGANLAQTITGISHKISNGDWETTIDAMNIVLDKKSGSLIDIGISKLKEMVKDAVELAIARANALGGGNSFTLPPNVQVTTAAQNAMKAAGKAVFPGGGTNHWCARYTYSLAKNYKEALSGATHLTGVTPSGGDANSQAYRDNLKALGWVEHNKGVLTKQQLKDLIAGITSMGWIVNYISPANTGPGHSQIYTDGVLDIGGHNGGGSNGTKWASSWADNYQLDFVYESVASDSWQTYLFTI